MMIINIINLILFFIIITHYINEKPTYPTTLKKFYLSITKLPFSLYRHIGRKKNDNFSILLVFTFAVILLSNLHGMFPYTFTTTSSLIVTLTLTISLFHTANTTGFYKSKWKMSNLFLPAGIPGPIIPFLIIIEFVSYIARIFSLSIRLFANMLSGHALLKILSSFGWKAMNAGGGFLIIAMLPYIVVLFAVALEVIIALLQAYVFTTLATIYFSDTLTPGH